jgi:hypothetical protein
MIAKIIDHPEAPFLHSARLLMRIAHDILLAGAGWIIITVGSQLPVLLHPELAPFQLSDVLQDPEPINYLLERLIANPTWIMITFASVLVIVAGIIFWLQDVVVRPERAARMTPTEFLWTLISFPMLPILTLVVVAVPTLLAQTRLLLGIPLQFRVTRKI